MSVFIIYKENDIDSFLKYWNILFQEQKTDYSYFPENLEMNVVLSKERGLFVADKSFVYLIDGRVEAGVHIIIEKNNVCTSMTASSGYLPAPLFSNNKIGKEVFSIIQEIAELCGVEKIMFSVGPMRDTVFYNYLEKYGFLNTSILSYVVENEEPQTFLKNMRKGHRCDIKKMLQNTDIEVFFVDENNVDYSVHSAYVDMHHICSGKVTRSDESFNLQFESLKNGRAVLVGIKLKNIPVAYGYFEYNHDKGIYYSGVDDPTIQGLSLYHILLYSAFDYLYKKGVRYIDTGQPSSPSSQLDYVLDDKQKNIGLFKRGFPGEFRTNYRGIKYLSKDLCKNDIENMLQKYITTVFI